MKTLRPGRMSPLLIALFMIFPHLLLTDAAAQTRLNESVGSEDKGTLTLTYENDSFIGEDDQYTNGIRLSWLSDVNDVPAFVRRAAEATMLFPGGGDARIEYAIGQNMYTPSDITLEFPPEDDRPYAGWLYGMVGIAVENGSRLHQMDLKIGMVGPSSLAEDTQELIHDYVTNSPEPQGWDTQLPDEPTIQLTYQRSWRGLGATELWGMDADFTPFSGLSVGTVYNYIEVGAMSRLGSNLSLDYGPPRIQYSPGGTGYFVRQPGFEWYIFGGAVGRAIVHNIFLDGTVFEESRSVDKKYFIGEFLAGFALSWKDVRLAYTQVFRTPEFDGQDELEEYGSLTLSVKF